MLIVSFVGIAIGASYINLVLELHCPIHCQFSLCFLSFVSQTSNTKKEKKKERPMLHKTLIHEALSWPKIVHHLAQFSDFQSYITADIYLGLLLQDKFSHTMTMRWCEKHH